jgi:uncharacterized protein
MPEDGSRLCNVAALADEARQVELEVPLARLGRVVPRLLSTEGAAKGRVALDRYQGHVVAEVSVEAQVSLECQRCLLPLSLPIAGGSRVVLVESEAAVSHVPPELETVLAPDGRMRLADLVEEELLLALPPAPRHPEGQCPGDAPGPRSEESAEPTQRPFASLGELLKSGRSKS